MRNEYKVFLGVDNNGEAVYAEVTFGRTEVVDDKSIRKGYFAVSFTTAYADKYNDESLLARLEERVEDYPDETIGELLKRHPSLTYNELPEFILRNDGTESVLEIDYFFPQLTMIDGDEVAFVFCSGGQSDTRSSFLDEEGNLLDKAKLAVPIEFYHELHDMWDKYHLSHYDGERSYGGGKKIESHNLEELDKFEKEFFTEMEYANEKMEKFLKDHVVDLFELELV